MVVRSAKEIVTSDYISKRNKVTKSLYSEYRQYNTKRDKSTYSEREARNRAAYLARRLNNPSRIMFYLKCAWNLTDNYLDKLLDISLNGKDNPIYYFSKSAAREMRNNGE